MQKRTTPPLAIWFAPAPGVSDDPGAIIGPQAIVSYARVGGRSTVIQPLLGDEADLGPSIIGVFDQLLDAALALPGLRVPDELKKVAQERNMSSSEALETLTAQSVVITIDSQPFLADRWLFGPVAVVTTIYQKWWVGALYPSEEPKPALTIWQPDPKDHLLGQQHAQSD